MLKYANCQSNREKQTRKYIFGTRYTLVSEKKRKKANASLNTSYMLDRSYQDESQTEVNRCHLLRGMGKEN